MRHFAVFGLALFLAACGSSTPDLSRAIERTAASQCPSSPQQLTGTKPQDAACQDALECAPTCCSCSTGQWLGVSCRDGKCASAAVACADTRGDPVLSCN